MMQTRLNFIMGAACVAGAMAGGCANRSRNIMKLLNLIGFMCACGVCFAQSAVAPIDWDSPVGPVKPFYRLGVTIENYPEVARYNILPPEECGGLYIAAAKDSDGHVAVMVANCDESPKPLSVNFGKVVSCRITDGTRTYSEIKVPDALPAHSFIIVKSELR